MNSIVEEKPVEEKAKVEETPRLDMIDILAREGARKMLLSALEEEVAMLLGRCRYKRTKRELKGYRNGTRERKLQVLERLRIAYYAKSREEARAHLALLVDDLEARYPKAAECAGKDWKKLGDVP